MHYHIIETPAGRRHFIHLCLPDRLKKNQIFWVKNLHYVLLIPPTCASVCVSLKIKTCQCLTYTNASLMSAVLLIQFITEISWRFHLPHRPLPLTADPVCHIICPYFVRGLCVGDGRGGFGSLHTSTLSLAAHPAEKLPLITAVCLSH